MLPSTAGLTRGDFTAGALISLANPFALAFWRGLGGVVGTRVADPAVTHDVVFFVGFMAGATDWAFLIAGLIAWGSRFVGPGLFRVVNLAAASRSAPLARSSAGRRPALGRVNVTPVDHMLAVRR